MLILTNYLVARKEETGQEFEKIIYKKNIGISPVNPLKRLEEKKKLTKQQLKAALKYQYAYERANKINFARPSYNEFTENNRNDKSLNFQESFEFSKYVAEQKNILAIKDTINKKRYLLILAVIFEKQISLRNAEKITKLNHKILEERIAEICDILMS